MKNTLYLSNASLILLLVILIQCKNGKNTDTLSLSAEKDEFWYTGIISEGLVSDPKKVHNFK